MLTRSKYSNKVPHPLVPRFPVLKPDAFSDKSAEVVYNAILRQNHFDRGLVLFLTESSVTQSQHRLIDIQILH